ncbi:MAG: transporter substrate-binding domain-containing protein [Alphaproteobacteria bacterium]
MKNAIITIAIALLATFVGVKVFAPAGGAAAAKETAYERVMRTGVLRCGYGMWPPHMLIKDPQTGKVGGIMHDIVEDMASRLSLKVEWAEETGWGNWIEAMRSGRFDAFCAGNWMTAERGRYVSYLTPPLFYNPVYAYVRVDETRFDAYDFTTINRPDIKISAQDGEMSDLIAKKYFPLAQAVNIPQLADLNDILLNVAMKKADIVFNEASFVNGFLAQNPGKLKKLSDKPFNIFSLALSIPQEENRLKGMMETALTEMQGQGVIEKIVRSYEPDPGIILMPQPPYGGIKD